MFEPDFETSSSWKEFLDKPQVGYELEKIAQLLGDKNFYPEEKDVLRFMAVPAENVKHVIIGMDPYPSSNGESGIPQATGRSFEVSELRGKTWDYKFKQSSLRNILKAIHRNETGRDCSLDEIRSEINRGIFPITQFPEKWFDEMELQGVMFLNASLTVYPGEPGSHVEIWKKFRSLLSHWITEKSPGAKWHLWGKVAQCEYEDLVPKEQQLACSHPRLAKFVLDNTLALARDVNWLGISNNQSERL